MEGLAVKSLNVSSYGEEEILLSLSELHFVGNKLYVVCDELLLSGI